MNQIQEKAKGMGPGQSLALNRQHPIASETGVCVCVLVSIGEWEIKEYAT